MKTYAINYSRSYPRIEAIQRNEKDLSESYEEDWLVAMDDGISYYMFTCEKSTSSKKKIASGKTVKNFVPVEEMFSDLVCWKPRYARRNLQLILDWFLEFQYWKNVYKLPIGSPADVQVLSCHPQAIIFPKAGIFDSNDK